MPEATASYDGKQIMLIRTTGQGDAMKAFIQHLDTNAVQWVSASEVQTQPAKKGRS